MKPSLPKMADVSTKTETRRRAVAYSRVNMKEATLTSLKEGKTPKGDVLSCAKIAGIMAAKKTHELLPLCHPLGLDNIDLSFEFDEGAGFVSVTSDCVSFGKTGVEMEALTAAAIAALTIYDMCKPIDKDMVISDIKLLKKSGGKSGDYERKD